MKIAALCLALLSAAVSAGEKPPTPNGLEVRFKTEREGTVLVNIYRPDGVLVRRLEPGKSYPKGAHTLAWDGLVDDGKMAEPGEYTWKGLFHEGIGLKLRGWVANESGVPWSTADGDTGWGWGGDAGTPSAVAADDKKVYLGWSLADHGSSVLACDLEGRVQWSHRGHARTEGKSGCKALAVDDGLVYVLGGLEGVAAEGGAIYRLSAKDGAPVPWPSGATELKISSFWPADGKSKPDTADAMAVRHGHIYLSFTGSQFLTVLDAKTGDYLQTVVGAAPGMIDIAPTKTELPDAPGKLSDADFGLVSLGGGVLGRILFAHDPFWVITSDMTPTERDETITALTVIGDGAKFHQHTAFVGFGAPLHQVQARPLLDTENPTWIAGQKGGRALLGPWKADDLHAIRGVALAADGRLWVAEGDAYPKRFSVWDTNGKEGKLVREFFGPPADRAPGGAIDPLDPDVMVAQNCEWRLDHKTGRATCLGIIAREEIGSAHFGIGKNGHAYLITSVSPFGFAPISIFERLGDGDYKLRTRVYYTDKAGNELHSAEEDKPANTIFWWDINGDGKEQPNERRIVPYVINFGSPRVTQDLTLRGSVYEPDRYGLSMAVQSWTECGAPVYEPSTGARLPSDAFAVSNQGKYFLTQIGKTKLEGIACVEASTGRQTWNLMTPENDPIIPFLGGSAELGPPLNDIWVMETNHGTWRILTEDGFEFADLLTGDPEKIRWPKAALPGADMTHADSQGAYSGGITHAVNGKLYLQTGRCAYWNLEFTGLEKVKALPGGKLAVPVAK